MAGYHDPRLLTGSGMNEDAAVVRFPAGKALVQTVDFFTPVVNDPYRFGRIAAANALSDVYAMGGEPVAAMNIVCFPRGTLPLSVLRDILRGGLDAVLEARAVMAGGHSVEDPELKYGLAVSGAVDPERMARNDGLKAGDVLILTKPLGSGVLATAVKAAWDGAEALEDTLFAWASRLNAAGGRVIRELGLSAATDVTGFGLGGHALEMARASGVDVELFLEAIPFMDRALELAALGLIPVGSHANAAHFACRTERRPGIDPLKADLVFDAQTSGGMLLAVPGGLVPEASARLAAAGDLAAVVGRVLPADGAGPRLVLAGPRP